MKIKTLMVSMGLSGLLMVGLLAAGGVSGEGTAGCCEAAPVVAAAGCVPLEKGKCTACTNCSSCKHCSAGGKCTACAKPKKGKGKDKDTITAAL